MVGKYRKLSFLYFPTISVILTFVPVFPYHYCDTYFRSSIALPFVMVGKYRNESKDFTNGRENTGTKVNITLMV
jgi:hypothetical protein